MLIINELITCCIAVFVTDGFGDGQSYPARSCVVAPFVKGLEYGFLVEGFVVTRVADGQGVANRLNRNAAVRLVVDESVFQQVVHQ